jgi:hypothetical protein
MESTEEASTSSVATAIKLANSTAITGVDDVKVKSGGTFRRQIAPVINNLLEDFDSAPLHINANKELDKIIRDLDVIAKAIEELRKTLKTEKRGKTNTQVASKITKSIDKAILIASSHEVNKDDAQKVLAAIRTGAQKLTSHVNALKAAKDQSSEKERFSF